MLLSFIIPTFNSSKTIEISLFSILNQKIKDYEIIVVDDQSTDGTVEIIKNIAKKYKNLHLYKNKINSGPGICRNIGLKKAKGHWIYFLDSDDSLNKNSIKNHLAFLKKPHYDFIVGSYTKNNNGSKKEMNHNISHEKLFNKKSLTKYINDYIYEPYKYTLFVHCWGKFYLNKIIKQNNLEFKKLNQLEDVNFNFKYLNQSKSILYSNKKINIYNITNEINSLSKKSGTENNMFEHIEIAYSSVKTYLKDNLSIKDCLVKEKYNHLVVTTLAIWFVRMSKVMSYPDLYKALDTSISKADKKGYLENFTYMQNNSYIMHMLIKYKLKYILCLFLKIMK
jgi:glycosyltransferase involved in cell wall biosynthesis